MTDSSRESRSRRSLRLVLGFAASWAAVGAGLHAHDLGRSESDVIARGAEVHVRLTLDLLEVDGIDRNGDLRVSYGELDEGIDRLYAIVKGHLTIQGAAPPVRTALERYTVSDDHVGRLDLLLTFDGSVSRLAITSTLHQVLRPSHEHLTRVSFDTMASARNAVLSATMSRAEFAQGSKSYPASAVLGLLAGAALACVAAVQFARRAFRR